jgi:outer membrane protein insertion porin family
VRAAVVAACLTFAGAAYAQAPVEPVAAPEPAPTETPTPPEMPPRVEPPPPPPGPVLADYTIEGELIEGEETLRAVFDSVMEIGKPWPDLKDRAIRLGESLAYRVTVETKSAPRGVSVVLRLERAPRIRYVEIHGNWPLFEEEIKSRLKLRPGSILAVEKQTSKSQLTRADQLAEEEEGIKTYLTRVGYFDARVVLTLEPIRKHEYRLRVRLYKGPRYRIGVVKVVGNSALSEEEIRAKFQRDPWWKRWLSVIALYDVGYSKEGLNADIEEIRKEYQTRGFPRAQVTHNFDPKVSLDRLAKTVNFIVTINEGKRIEVVFDGLSGAMSEKSLKEVLTFNAESSYDDYEVERSKEAMRELYQRNGFFQAQVAHERVPLTDRFERIFFYVDEGPRLRVVGIDIRGNRTFTSTRLGGLISTRIHPGTLAFIQSGGYVTNLQLQQDVEALTDFYRRQGFAKAKVTAHVATDPRLLEDVGALAGAVTSGERGRGLHIRFDIDEGPRNRVAVRDFVGNRGSITDAVLARRVRLAPGVPFTPEALDEDVEAIARLYRERGFGRATVTPVTEGAGENIRVTYEIKEGEPVRVGKILVRGNFLTRKWVIRELLDLKEGDLLTADKIEEGYLALRTTDLFASVRSELIGDEGASGPVHVVIEVQERHDNSGTVELGAGFSTDNSAFAALTWRVQNIGGVGALFQFATEVGTQIQRGTATFALPYWTMRHALGLPLRFELQGKYRREDTPRFGVLQTIGGSVIFSRQFGSGLSLALKYDYNRFNRPEELVRPAGSAEEDDETQIETVTASVGPSIILDKRRNAAGIPSPLAPVRGFFISASAAWASQYLLGSDDFLKFSLAGQLFIPIGKRIVISNGVRYDHGYPLEESVLPEIERFTAGGDTTVRGYEEDRLLTEVIRMPVEPVGGAEQIRVVPAGGNIRFIHNLDLQIRVANLAGMPLASAIFLDTGIVTNSLDDFRFRRLRHGLGVALLRLVSPVASFSLEYAIPLDPQTGDDPTGRLHFNLGFVF